MIGGERSEVVCFCNGKKREKILGIGTPDLRTTFTCGNVGCETCNLSNKIQSEFNKKFEEIKTLENERNKMDAQENITEWVQKKEELEMKKKELPIWLKAQLKPLEEKKKENFEKFKKVDIYFGDWNNDLIESVCEGDMRIEDYMNLYKEWKLENLKALKSSNVIQGFNLVNILPNYDGINSLNRENLQKLEKAFWFRLPLSQLESLNKINISDQRLKQIEELRAGWKCGALEIEDPKILEDTHNIPVESMKQCIQSGAVPKPIKQFFTCTEGELKNMIQLRENLGTTFGENFLSSYRRYLGLTFDFEGLKEIMELFGIKEITDYELDDIGGKIFNDKIERFKKFKQLWKPRNKRTKLSIDDIVELNKLTEEQSEKAFENLGKLQDLGITLQESCNERHDIKFLSEFSEDWTYKPDRHDPWKYKEIVIYPFLCLFRDVGLRFPDKSLFISGGGMSKVISALLKPGYNPKGTNPDKLKEFLDIDRENVEKLKKQGINFNLNFFVQYDKEKQEYQKINTKIEVQNFEEINKKYHLIRDNEWADKAKEHIQEGYLDIDDIDYLLTEFRIGKNRDFDLEEYKEFFEKYKKEDRKNNKKYSLKEALVFMDQYVKEHSQGEPSKE